MQSFQDLSAFSVRMFSNPFLPFYLNSAQFYPKPLEDEDNCYKKAVWKPLSNSCSPVMEWLTKLKKKNRPNDPCFIGALSSKILPQAYFSNSLYIPKYFYFKIEQIITSSGWFRFSLPESTEGGIIDLYPTSFIPRAVT